QAGGLTVGILPGASHRDANPFVDISIVTDLGHARNAVVVRSAHAVIALPGEYGTLSEVALALKMGIPVVGLRSWEHLDRVVRADTPPEAVALALSWAERVHAKPR
ncbi:MAG: LOG family protein, partial [Candidatus Rokubacteria bacterium]|nr:LOG family protein [Candidatus Rokubacteria bacterium]